MKTYSVEGILFQAELLPDDGRLKTETCSNQNPS
jgi:hypothetical protein